MPENVKPTEGEEVEIMIAPDGTIAFIHNDSVTEQLRQVGDVSIKRASNVEPTENGQWNVDMTPVGGPERLPETFDRRSDALASEVQYLKEHFAESVNTLFQK